jgi:hypothetical protein
VERFVGGRDEEGLADHLEDALGDERRCRAERRPVEEDDELVATHPADRVDVAQSRREALRERPQQLVPRFVPERVVDVLEAVEIEVEHRAERSMSATAHDQLLQPIVDQCSIRKACERVVERLMAQLVHLGADEPQGARAIGAQGIDE